jgi:hypothetical protein
LINLISKIRIYLKIILILRVLVNIKLLIFILNILLLKKIFKNQNLPANGFNIKNLTPNQSVIFLAKIFIFKKKKF